MSVIVGIDPGWSSKNPSAVALVTGTSGSWTTLRVAPSFSTFVDQPERSDVELGEVLAHAVALAGEPIDVAAVDMPLATVPIVACRAADRLVSERYGGGGCAVHSPTPEAALSVQGEIDKIGQFGHHPGRSLDLSLVPSP